MTEPQALGELVPIPTLPPLTVTVPVRLAEARLEALVSTVPASSGNVSVLSVFVAGLLIVNTPVPEALGVSAILLMAYPIRMSSVNAFSSSGVVAAAIRASDVTSRSACLSVAIAAVSPLSSKARI
jgi:hypothetical protein